MDYQTIINNPNFEKIEELKHDDIKQLILREMNGNQGYGLIIKMYQVLGLIALMLGMVKAFAPFYKHQDPQMLIGVGLGILFSFTVLVVIHELIHAIAYLLVGVRHLSFGMKLKKFLFYVQADKEVVNYSQFRIVAIAPAIVVAVISLVGIIWYFGQPPYYFFLTVLGLHSLFCGGDFGLLCFFENRKEDEIYTFDVKSEGKTYFYKRV